MNMTIILLKIMINLYYCKIKIGGEIGGDGERYFFWNDFQKKNLQKELHPLNPPPISPPILVSN